MQGVAPNVRGGGPEVTRRRHMPQLNILITGGAGMLGTAFTEFLTGSRHRMRSLAHADLDVRDRSRVLAEAAFAPDVVIHAAGIVNADYCEEHRDECFESHVSGTENIIELCRMTGAKLFFPQSFLIFDGTEAPATEETSPRPLSVYGEAKWCAEQKVREQLPAALIVRMGGFFGGYEKDKNFVGKFAQRLKKNVVANQKSLQGIERIWQPTFTEELARNSVYLIEQNATGVYHMASHGSASFFDVARAMVEILGFDERISIEKVPSSYFEEICRRPENGTMENKRLQAEGRDRMSHWRAALAEYLRRPYFQNLFVDLM